MPQQTTLTDTAKAIARGMNDLWMPDRVAEETSKLANLFRTMAQSRDASSDCHEYDDERRIALRDTGLLLGLADRIEEQEKIIAKNTKAKE